MIVKYLGGNTHPGELQQCGKISALVNICCLLTFLVFMVVEGRGLLWMLHQMQVGNEWLLRQLKKTQDTWPLDLQHSNLITVIYSVSHSCRIFNIYIAFPGRLSFCCHACVPEKNKGTIGRAKSKGRRTRLHVLLLNCFCSHFLYRCLRLFMRKSTTHMKRCHPWLPLSGQPL